MSEGNLRNEWLEAPGLERYHRRVTRHTVTVTTQPTTGAQLCASGLLMALRNQLRELISALESRWEALSEDSTSYGQDIVSLLRRCESLREPRLRVCC